MQTYFDHTTQLVALLGGPIIVMFYAYATFATIKYVDERSDATLKYVDDKHQDTVRMLNEIKESVVKTEERVWELYRNTED